MCENVAVLIPCYNEELTVGSVIDDFRDNLPGAVVYVYDNNSIDKTADIARLHGAIVVHAPIQGKGAVVKQMFKEIDADIYLMVDGDATYPAKFAFDLIEKLDSADMVLGDRLSSNYFESNKRCFHGFGNWLVRFLVNKLYKGNIPDIMTGYRAFSRRFVKSIQLKYDGFEVETEMSIFALKNGYSIESVSIEYKDRPDGSISKLNTFSDGFKVLKTIFKLHRQN
ncbi:glycosyltransferase [bacterium]|nr:glycosyltransferase [bacterium]